jgi:hypothetical protein
MTKFFENVSGPYIVSFLIIAKGYTNVIIDTNLSLSLDTHKIFTSIHLGPNFAFTLGMGCIS